MTTQLLPTKIFKNCYSAEILDELRQKYLELGELSTYIHNWEGPNFEKVMSHKRKIDFSQHPEIKQLILNGLPEFVRSAPIIQNNVLLQSLIPYEVHCDCGWLKPNEDETMFYVFVIPFETVNAKTITFDQTADYLHFVDYKKFNAPLPPDQCITVEEYEKHLSHCWPQEREYLSIDSIFDWEAGSIFMFDARRWHSSNNFNADGVSEKNALVLMSNIKIKDIDVFY
jgi:hypothetical protein